MVSIKVNQKLLHTTTPYKVQSSRQSSSSVMNREGQQLWAVER